jgi:hypothetical protein
MSGWMSVCSANEEGQENLTGKLVACHRRTRNMMYAFRAVGCYSTARVQAVAQENKTDHERWCKFTSLRSLVLVPLTKCAVPS